MLFRSLLHLNFSYVTGVFVVVLALVLSVLYIVYALSPINTIILWVVSALIAFISGLSVLMGYYRRGKGTLLWLPRSLAEYLTERAKKTKRGVEAAALGGMTVVAELPFTVGIVLILTLIIKDFYFYTQLEVIVIYALIVTLPLLIITTMLGAGERLSRVQRWREANKDFFQYASGFGLLLISLYIVVFHVARMT